MRRLWAKVVEWWAKPENPPLDNRLVFNGAVTVTGQLTVKKAQRRRSLRQEREARRRRPLGQ